MPKLTGRTPLEAASALYFCRVAMNQEPMFAHSRLAVLKGTGVMQAGGLLLAVVGDNAVSLLGQNLLVVRLQEVVVTVDNGVLAVQDAEQRGGRTPSVVDVAVDTGLFH